MTDISTETQPAKHFDPEAFAMNFARAMENSGKALAAYLKPRESGEVVYKPPNELAEVVKTLTGGGIEHVERAVARRNLQPHFNAGTRHIAYSAFSIHASMVGRTSLNRGLHAPQWEKAQAFNALLDAFVEACG